MSVVINRALVFICVLLVIITINANLYNCYELSGRNQRRNNKSCTTINEFIHNQYSMIDILHNSILYYNTHMTMRQQDHKIKDSYFNFLVRYKILKLYLKNIHS
jgi:hypothetical protein